MSNIGTSCFCVHAEGRHIYQLNRGTPERPLNICTAWFDEYGVHSEDHIESQSFIEAHRQWATKRTQKLAKHDEVRRIAQNTPLAIPSGHSLDELADQLAPIFQSQAQSLHHHHYSTDPHSGKRVSFGLIRMANINPLVLATRALASLDIQPNYRLHLCCYHSQHPMLVRSNIEQRLDQFLNRQEPSICSSTKR